MSATEQVTLLAVSAVPLLPCGGLLVGCMAEEEDYRVDGVDVAQET